MEKQANLINLEVLKMAKELVENQYLDYRAKEHNKWLTESERLWDTQRVKLDYPTIDPYPTEEDIVTKAKVLLGFLSDHVESTEKIVEQLESKTETNNVTVNESNVKIVSNSAVETASTAEIPSTVDQKPAKKTKVPLPPEESTRWVKAKIDEIDRDEETSIGRVSAELLRALHRDTLDA